MYILTVNMWKDIANEINFQKIDFLLKHRNIISLSNRNDLILSEQSALSQNFLTRTSASNLDMYTAMSSLAFCFDKSV